VLNPLWVAFFIGERPGSFALLGALIVLAGVVINAVGSAGAAPTTG
jgi:drug/metabolite transporter (DMT)-like permease